MAESSLAKLQSLMTDQTKKVIHLSHIGQFKEAVEVATQLCKVVQQSIGKTNSAYVACLNNLARMYHLSGLNTQAASTFREVMDIWSLLGGKQTSDYATCLKNLGDVYRDNSQYSEAEVQYVQALAIYRSIAGEFHLDCASTLSGLAELYSRVGRHSEAESIYRQVIEIRRYTVGDRDPDFFLGLHDLGITYHRRGNYEAADRLYRQSRDGWLDILGKEHPNHAISLNSMASLYRDIGNYAKAIDLYSQSLACSRKTLGQQHPYTVSIMANLALLYRDIGAYAEAEVGFREVMAIRQTLLGPTHPDYGTSLDNLAAVRTLMGDHISGQQLHQQAIEIIRSTLGEQHPEYAGSLNNLAMNKLYSGDFLAAESLFRKSVGIWRSTLGEQHPDYALGLSNLARVCVANDCNDEAIDLMEQVAVIDDRLIRKVFSITSESQRIAYLDTIRTHFDRFLSLVSQNLRDSSTASLLAFDLVLRRKAIVAEASLQRNAWVRQKYPSLENKLYELTALSNQIVQKSLAGAGSEGFSTYRKLLRTWENQVEEIELELARQIPEVNLEQKTRSVDRKVIADTLPEGTVLVEFVSFQNYDFSAVRAHGASQWKPERYLAFVLPAKKPDEARMFDLGEAQPIDEAIGLFRTLITGESENDGRFTRDSRQMDPARSQTTSEGIKLRSAVFDPLVAAFQGNKELFLAPDGDLTRLPFEVLPTDCRNYLIDQYKISYLAVGRDLFRAMAPSFGKASDPIVIADPDFDLAKTPSNEPATVTDETAFIPIELPGDLREMSLHFNRLPGTRREGIRIGKLLGVQPLLDDLALEASIKACRSPRILHVATHGFFLNNQNPRPDSHLNKTDAGDWYDHKLSGARLQNPLLRSGLALAGINTWLKDESLPNEAEDGVLTAADVTGIDLLNTELVVLSACETGLGDVKVGEGVFGLRRAFALAGCKTLVMSLWKVADDQTCELMENFYNLLLSGGTRRDSLRRAQLLIKARYPHPFYWGAFICQGDISSLPRG